MLEITELATTVLGKKAEVNVEALGITLLVEGQYVSEIVELGMTLLEGNVEL